MTKEIVIVEPFYSGSHKVWTDGLTTLFGHDNHKVYLLTMPGRHWKWRMFGAASYLAERLLSEELNPDVLIVSDMLDLPVFLGIARARLNQAKIVVYFHENQLTYPWSPTDADVKLNRDKSYGLINVRTALAADEIYFNSEYHKTSFTTAAGELLNEFPDGVNKDWKNQIFEKSKVLHLGMDLEPVLTLEKERVEQPILIWNHRWEYDKNPEAFFEALKQLKEEGISFQLIVCGEKTKKYPRVFDQLKEVFADELIHFGYAASRKEYLELLRRATVLPVTSNQDFFGGSVVEGIAAGCIPVLPQRLAYPEHLPDQLKDEYMANNDKEWYELLKDVVKNYEIHAKNTAVLRQFVARYDWKAQSTGYAEMLK